MSGRKSTASDAAVPLLAGVFRHDLSITHLPLGSMREIEAPHIRHDRSKPAVHEARTFRFAILVAAILCCDRTSVIRKIRAYNEHDPAPVGGDR